MSTVLDKQMSRLNVLRIADSNVQRIADYHVQEIADKQFILSKE